MLECKICGTKFNAIIERHYIARDNGKTGLAVAFGSTAEESLYDTFDCPMCGCQVIAKERKLAYVGRERTNTALRKITSLLLQASGASIKALNLLQMMLP